MDEFSIALSIQKIMKDISSLNKKVKAIAGKQIEILDIIDGRFRNRETMHRVLQFLPKEPMNTPQEIFDFEEKVRTSVEVQEELVNLKTF